MSSNGVIRGLSVSPGIVKGRARVLRGTDELNEIEEGEILVIPNSHPMYSIAVMKASAVVTEVGGRLSHICVVAMEMGITCVTQADNITNIVANGQIICVDGNEGVIYIY
jgi:pyruvate,water dikinase